MCQVPSPLNGLFWTGLSLTKYNALCPHVQWKLLPSWILWHRSVLCNKNGLLVYSGTVNQSFTLTELLRGSWEFGKLVQLCENSVYEQVINRRASENLRVSSLVFTNEYGSVGIFMPWPSACTGAIPNKKLIKKVCPWFTIEKKMGKCVLWVGEESLP